MEAVFRHVGLQYYKIKKMMDKLEQYQRQEQMVSKRNLDMENESASKQIFTEEMKEEASTTNDSSQ